jgi:hypothetical protein
MARRDSIVEMVVRFVRKSVSWTAMSGGIGQT